jgi:hypothetical protein
VASDGVEPQSLTGNYFKRHSLKVFGGTLLSVIMIGEGQHWADW